MGALDVAAEDAVPEVLLRGLGGRGPTRSGTLRHRSQPPAGRVQDVARLHVSDHAQDHVLGAIVAAVEVHQLVAREAAQHPLVADPPAPDPMDAEREFVELLGGERRGIVHLPAGFLDDGFQLPGQLRRIDQRVHQGIRLDLQPLRESAGGKREVVVGEVVVGPRVQLASEGLHLAGDLIGRGAARRPLEEHVLDDVGNPDFVVFFVEIARFHPHVQGDHGRGVALLHEDREPVGKPFPGDVVGETAPGRVDHGISIPVVALEIWLCGEARKTRSV
jgi:hypothetical protein